MQDLSQADVAQASGWSTPRHPSRRVSRRRLIQAGSLAGFVGALGWPHLAQAQKPRFQTSPQLAYQNQATHDVDLLNNALYYEYQAIWAYGVAVSKLSDSNVGKAVLALGLANQTDHKAHAQALEALVRQLGGKPAMPAASYDLSFYIQRGEGNLDTDVNIAKLALALEVDAAIAYTEEIAKLKTPELITAGASIGSDEAAHATAIRAAMGALGLDLRVVGAALVSKRTRNAWIVKV